MTPFDAAIVGRTMWQEARGEPLLGQQATAHTLVNRFHSGRWGKSLAEVCLWHAQFSGWASSDPNFGLSCRLSDSDPVLVKLTGLVTLALNGEADLTKGALFYYATYLKKPPDWAAMMLKLGQFGNQIFLTDQLITRIA